METRIILVHIEDLLDAMCLVVLILQRYMLAEGPDLDIQCLVKMLVIELHVGVEKEYYPGATYVASKYALQGYNSTDASISTTDIDKTNKYGQCNGILRRSVVGLPWETGARCGSRSLHAEYFSSCAGSQRGSRGCN